MAMFIGSTAFFSRVFSYDNLMTHPSLTDNIARIYNADNSQKLTSQEINWLKQGSIEEDKAPRWMNHFYNPARNEGLWSFSSAKDWSQSPNLQKIYFKSLGDQSWQKAIDSYTSGDKKEAFIALGHVLHLLEDMTVPAHSRLDAHPSYQEYEDLLKTNIGSRVDLLLAQSGTDIHLSGDPYEKWVEHNIGSNMGFGPSLSNAIDLNNVFDKLAKYSSENFFSKDTIKKEELIGENIVDKKLNGFDFQCIEKIIDMKKICIVFYKESKFGREDYLLDLKENISVHSDYYNLLAPKAVSYGAGVIKLFFEEAEKKKKEQEEKSWWQKVKEKASSWLGDVSGSLYAGFDPNLVVNEGPAPSGAEQSEAPTTPLGQPSVKNISVEAIVAQEKIKTELPDNTISAEEKIGGEILEENSPENQEVPSEIIEEKDPGQAKLPNSGGNSPPTSVNQNDTLAPETAIISGPSAITASTTAIFIFESSVASSTFVCVLDNASSTPCTSPKEYSGLGDGSHVFKVSAIDPAGNQDQTPAEHSWIINLAPEVNLSVSDYNLTSIDFTVNWNSSSSDISLFDVQYKVDSGNWQDWAIAIATTSKPFEAEFDDILYHFRARGIDSAGNQGSWREIQVPISQKPVIINEIMCDPNPGSDFYYEYIELYNRSPFEIDLAGWQFVANGDIHQIFADEYHGGSSTVMLPGSFALLTEENSSTTSPSVYDGYYSVSAYSSSALRLRIDDASLDLFNAITALILKNGTGEIIDEVSYSPVWGARDNGKSLERINYNNIYSQTQMAWAESVAGGTPNAANSVLDVSAGTPIPDNVIISQDIIWPRVGSPYLLYSNAGAYPSVNAAAKLIIEPGTILKPQNKYYYALYVNGTLKVNGTGADPVLFTSKEISPQSGDWGTAIYFSSSSINSTLSYATFEYGGFQAPWPTLTINPAVVVNNSKVIINDCIFNSSQTRGLDLINSSSSVSDSQFSSSTSVAIYINGGQPSISENTLQNFGNVGSGIKIENQSKPVINSNAISGFDYAIWIESSYPDLSGNDLSNNNYNGIYIDDHTVISQNTTWQSGNVYLLMSNAGQYPIVATSTTLTIEPGTIIKPLNRHYAALKIEGSLMADGNSSSTWIHFTSFYDDSSGGDSNNDGVLTNATSTRGDWKNILFAVGSESTLNFVQFQYGGYKNSGFGDYRVKEESIIIESGAQVSIQNITID